MTVLSSNPSNQHRSHSFGRTLRRSALGGAAAALALCGLPALAGAQEAAPEDPAVQEKLQCSQSFEQAQRLRNESKYLEANAEVLKCANPKCGEALFQECTSIYNDLQQATPSVVFQARDVEGHELVDVQVVMDGKEVATELNGKPMLVDPGSHSFVFTAPGAPPATKTVVVRAGEKYRQVLASLDVGRKSELTPVAAAPVAAPPETRKRIPVASYVLAGVSVVAVGGFVALRVIGASDYDELDKNCSPNCGRAEVDKVEKKYMISNIALGVGGAALAGAIVIYAASPREEVPRTAFFLKPSQDGVYARALTRF